MSDPEEVEAVVEILEPCAGDAACSCARCGEARRRATRQMAGAVVGGLLAGIFGEPTARAMGVRLEPNDPLAWAGRQMGDRVRLRLVNATPAKTRGRR